MRLLLVLLFVPLAAAQSDAPSLRAEVDTGEFVLEAEAYVVISGVLTCSGPDLDPDTVYTLRFESNHYGGDINLSGVYIHLSDPVVIEAPCFPGGADEHAWEAEAHILDVNATPGAMYHMDIMVVPSVEGSLEHAVPEGASVHTMAAIPEPVVQQVAEPAQDEAAPAPMLLLALALALLGRRR